MLHRSHTLSHIAAISREPRFSAKRLGIYAQAFLLHGEYSVASPRLLAPIAAIALAACSMQQTPALPTGSAPSAPTGLARSPAAAPSPSVSPQPDSSLRDDACDTGGLRATPCKIDFTPANPGAAAVTVTTSGAAKGRFAAQDDCTKSGVAAISQQASDQWLVTAGLKRGTCTVRFDSSTTGSDAGQTVLRIKNDV